MYHRRLGLLKEDFHYKAIEFYILFKYAYTVFEGFIHEEYYTIMSQLASFMREMMSEIHVDAINQQLTRLTIKIINILKELGAIDNNILSLASHMVQHFPLSCSLVGPMFISTFLVEDWVREIMSYAGTGFYQIEPKIIQSWNANWLRPKKLLSNKFSIAKGKYLLNIIHTTITGDYYFDELTNKYYKVIDIDNGKMTVKCYTTDTLHSVTEEITHFDAIPYSAVPCFVVKGKFIKIDWTDKLLL